MPNSFSEKYINSWPVQEARGLSPENLITLFEETLKGITNRFSLTLNCNTLMAIFRRVFHQSSEKYPILSGLKVEQTGISFEQFSTQFNQVDPVELSKAFRFLITEVITILSNFTADILPVTFDEQKNLLENSTDSTRLSNLYEISKALAGFESIEKTLLEIFTILTSTLSFQTILLLEKKDSTCKTTIWYDAYFSNEVIINALNFSRNSYEYLVCPLARKSDDINEIFESISKFPLPICSLEAKQNVSGKVNKFITLPLTLSNLETFGVLQFGTAAIMNESDLRFVSALSNLIAIALDRFNKEQNTQKIRQLEINERVRELCQAHEYVKSLEEERALRDQFVAILTHDLRTPLTVAKMATQVILKRPGDIDRNQILAKKIVTSIDRMDQMIKDLLDANRIRAGEPLTFNMNICDMRLIVLMTLKDLAISFGDRFMLKADRDKIDGFWNEDAIRRMIENLVNNAIKYGLAHELIIVTIEQSENNVKLTVHNTGNPIPLSEQKNLFRTFHRTSSANNGDKKGWGLGLTLVRGVAEAHGGYVEVLSNPKDGTSFIVTMPRDSRQFQTLNK